MKGAAMGQVEQVDEPINGFAEQTELTADEAPHATPLPARRFGFFGALSGGVITAILGFGLAQFVPARWPVADTSAFEARLAAQDTIVEALKAEVAALDAKLSDTGLQERVTAIEATVAAMPDLAPLDARVAALEAALGGGDPASSAAIAALRAEEERLKVSWGGDVAALTAEAEARMKEAEAQANQLKTEAEALAKDAKMRSALGRVQAALESGAPYASALQDLGADVPAVLQGSAATGLPTLANLQNSFPDAARLALAAALKDNMGESWADRVASFLRSQTGARSLSPREGSDPDAILSRAEAALAAGLVSLALMEVAALPDVAQTALKGWRQTAEQRLAAEAAVAAIVQRLGE